MGIGSASFGLPALKHVILPGVLAQHIQEARLVGSKIADPDTRDQGNRRVVQHVGGPPDILTISPGELDRRERDHVKQQRVGLVIERRFYEEDGQRQPQIAQDPEELEFQLLLRPE